MKLENKLEIYMAIVDRWYTPGILILNDDVPPRGSDPLFICRLGNLYNFI